MPPDMQQPTPEPNKSFLWAAVIDSVSIALAGGAGALIWWMKKKQS